METIDLDTALRITKSMDNKEIYVKYPGQLDADAKTVTMKEIKDKWNMKAVKISEIIIHWIDYDKTAFLFTIIP